jgi:hypothetical protein
MLKINDIARESSTVFRQLGRVVPKRLEGDAEIWYWSLPTNYRAEIEKDWDTLRKAFATYFLNRKWLDRQRGRANKASYRESGHYRETPSEYFIRKTELLNTVYNLDDSEVIMEVVDGAPSTWNTILTTQMYRDIVEFQSAIRYHEDALMRLDRTEREISYRERERGKDRDFQRNNPRSARVNAVGWSANLGPPRFPKDDHNVSKKATPESKGARPCRHCGSGKHWDNECKHSFKGNRAARTNLATSSSEDRDAQEHYDDLYYSLDSDDEMESGEESKQDFEQSLQITESSSYLVESNEKDENNSALGGGNELRNSSENSTSTTYTDTVDSLPLKTACTSYHAKPAFNRRTRRRLARDIRAVNFRIVHSQGVGSAKPVVELRKYMARWSIQRAAHGAAGETQQGGGIQWLHLARCKRMQGAPCTCRPQHGPPLRATQRRYRDARFRP